MGIEPTNKGFADLCLTTWLPRRGSEALVLSLLEPGAGDGTRTRDIDLGKVALYQLSYSRRCPLSISRDSPKCLGSGA